MKNLLLLLLVFPIIGHCQIDSSIDNYKYFVVKRTTYKNSKKIILKELKRSGYNVLDINDEFPDELEQNPDLALYVISEEACGYSDCNANFYLQTNYGNTIYQSNWRAGSSGIALKRAMNQCFLISININHRQPPIK